MNLELIRSICLKRKLPLAHLAKQIGLSKTGLYLAIDRNTLQAKHLEEISKILDVPIWEFFDIDPSTEIGTLKYDVDMTKQMVHHLNNRSLELEETMLREIELRNNLIERQKEKIEIQKEIIEKLKK